jgi:hypothetical protein
MTTQPKICRRCDRPVEVHADHYDTFEGMHWLCFHLEFEHAGDPDAACADPGCPWSEIRIYREKLVELGVDPKTVIEAAIDAHWYRPQGGA